MSSADKRVGGLPELGISPSDLEIAHEAGQVRSDLLNLTQESGFHGVEYFRRLDSKGLTIEIGGRSELNSRTIYFQPGSGLLLIFETKSDNPEYDYRSLIHFNLRTGNYLSSITKNEPKSDERLISAIQNLPPEYHEWLENPPGYKDLSHLIDNITSKEPIPVKDAEDLSVGDCILLFDGEKVKIARFSHLGYDKDPEAKGLKLIYFQNDSPVVTISSYYEGGIFACRENALLDNGRFGIMLLSSSSIPPLLKPYWDDFSPKKEGIWKISPEEFEVLSEFAESEEWDESMCVPLSREEYGIAVSLDAMAFERWGCDTEVVREANPKRYEAVSKKNFSKAIRNLVERFGAIAFSRAVKWVAYQHVLGLHHPAQKTKHLLAQDNVFDNVHSDIVGFRSFVSGLVDNLIDGAHPITHNMEKDGYGRVGHGVYNAKTIFGDVDFVEILRDEYPQVFDEFVDFLLRLPSIDQGDYYGGTTVNALGALKDFFPEAYRVIAEAKGNLPEYIEPGIIFPDNLKG